MQQLKNAQHTHSLFFPRPKSDNIPQAPLQYGGTIWGLASGRQGEVMGALPSAYTSPLLPLASSARQVQVHKEANRKMLRS